jgi:hypothetical protein
MIAIFAPQWREPLVLWLAIVGRLRAVAVMACDDEVMPSQQRIETVGDDADLQEVYDTERQLLYVACTRARSPAGDRRGAGVGIPRRPEATRRVNERQVQSRRQPALRPGDGRGLGLQEPAAAGESRQRLGLGETPCANISFCPPGSFLWFRRYRTVRRRPCASRSAGGDSAGSLRTTGTGLAWGRTNR